MKKIIGKVTTYHGTEHPYLKGYKVRIVAVMKSSMKPGIEDDDADNALLKKSSELDFFNRVDEHAEGGAVNILDEDDLARAGGVTIFDRIEVQPWLEKEGRFSFVTSDPRAQDLACFKHLAKGQ